MITDWFVSMSFDIAVWFASLFPEWEVPAWMTDARGMTIGLLEQFGTGLGVWIDWGVLGVCMIAVASAYGISFLILLFRRVFAHVPQFGGGGG